MIYKVYRFRVKSRAGELNRQAKAVNFVWNYANNAQKHAIKWSTKWPTAYDLMKLTTGTCEELGIGAATITSICGQYVSSRGRKPYLRYRGKRALGWIPFKAEQIKITPNGFVFRGVAFRVFAKRVVDGTVVDGGSFSQDKLGNWYLNVVVKIAAAEMRNIRCGVGIDLGLKELATLSTGEKIANPRHYQRLQERIATAQRARKKRQAAKAQAKAANCRKDHLHKASLDIVRRFDYIAVGNVKAAGLKQTNLGKSVSDAGWTTFRNMLRYKAIAHGATFEEVSERFTTQTCHECGSIAGPKGQTGLNERSWVCVHCGAIHDRDVNAAKNILFRGSGHGTLVEGIATSLVAGVPTSPNWWSPPREISK